ncbi:hypothetical protein BDQ17DRAFT_903816 [Cyathus striatus]|nr:hypothetical protein BDQ17DRAFT_903816 [Cyathus striatus]
MADGRQLYEYFITLDLEIKYIWNSRWTYIKIIYLTTRYLPFFDTSLVLWKHLYPHLSANDCHNLFMIIVWFFLIGMSIAEVIFTVRVWAVWGKNKWSTYFLPIFYLACWTPGYVILGRAVITAKFDIQDLIPRGCLATGGVDTLGISTAWAILLVYDIVIMILMLVPAVNAFKWNGTSQLTRVMYRDGIIYYIFLIILSLSNVLTGLAFSPDYITIVVLTGRVVRASLACRVVVHLREVGE